jgi:SAM-dependent methyltransferase
VNAKRSASEPPDGSGRGIEAEQAEIALRGDRAVADLRAQGTFWDKQLLYEGPELLDLEATPPGVKQRIMDDVEKITRLLLLYPLWTRSVGKMIVEARRTRRGKPVRVLDIGAGHGGLLFRIGDWAQRNRVPISLHGLDYDASNVQAARRAAAEVGRKVDFRAGDARILEDFDRDSMDIVITTFMLHHLPPGDVARVLCEMNRVAAFNFLAFDVRRSLPVVPLLWMVLRAGAFEAPTRHDSMASLRRGYTIPEIKALLSAARVDNSVVTSIAPAYFIASRV